MFIKINLQMEVSKHRVENKTPLRPPLSPRQHALQGPFPSSIYAIYSIKRALCFFSKRIYYPKGCGWEKANPSF